MATLTLPFGRWLAQYLASERGRQRSRRVKGVIYATLRRIGGDAMAQQLILRWLRFVCGSRFVQRSLFAQAIEHLSRFAETFKLTPEETREFLGLSLMAREWREWRQIAAPPAGSIARVTRVAGPEHFDACVREGKGVMLLLHHSQFARLSLDWLREHGHDSVIVGMSSQDQEKRGLQTPVQKNFELARQLHLAKHRLGKGGVVIFVPDAYQNLESFRMVEFFGRLRPIATGFAELGLKSGARLLPIAYRLSTDGLFTLEFAPPLQASDPMASHEARIDALIAQYAEFLRTEWKPYPWDLHWHHLDFYCQLPLLPAGPARRVANRRA